MGAAEEEDAATVAMVGADEVAGCARDVFTTVCGVL